MTATQQSDNRKRLVAVAVVYVALLTVIITIWAIGGRNEIHYWPFLLAWILAAGCFFASLFFAWARKAVPATFLLIAGGTMVVPVGLPAVDMAWIFLSRRHAQKLLYPLVTAVAAVVLVQYLIALLPDNVNTRPWRGPEGLLRGAPLSWCWPSNLQALLKGAPYDTLRHRSLLCVDCNDRLERASFAKLGFSRHHMRKANDILLKHVDPDLPRDAGTEVDAYTNTYAYRRTYEEAQKEAVNYLIENLDRQNIRKNGLLPVIIVDDAMTTERLFTLGAGFLVKFQFMRSDSERKESF